MTGFAVGVLVGALVGNLLLQVYGAIRVKRAFPPQSESATSRIRLFCGSPSPSCWRYRWSSPTTGSSAGSAPTCSPPRSPGSVMARTLMRVPLGVVGQGVGVASFPFLAQLYSEGKIEEFNRLLDSTMKGLIALLVPISALHHRQSAPVVYLVFSHTRLRGPISTPPRQHWSFFRWGCSAGARKTSWHAASMPRATPDSGHRRHAAHGRQPAPSTGCWCAARSISGLAMASSLGISVYTVILFVLLNRRTHNHQAGAITLFFFKVCAASAAVGWVCHRLQIALLEPHFAWHRCPAICFCSQW